MKIQADSRQHSGYLLTNFLACFLDERNKYFRRHKPFQFSPNGRIKNALGGFFLLQIRSKKIENTSAPH